MLDALRSLQSLADKYGATALDRQLSHLSRPPVLRIGFVGEWNSGKSTLINALLGQKVLPAVERPTTGNVTEVEARASDTKLSYWRYNDQDELEEIGRLEFDDIATGATPGRAVVRTPERPLLKEGWQLVDTPGIASLIDTHMDITYGYLPFLDGMVVCADINSGELNQTIVDFLRRPELTALRGHLIVALGRSDTMGAAELAEVVARNTRTLPGLLGGEFHKKAAIVAVSPLDALEGRGDGGLAEFVTEFTQHFAVSSSALRAARWRRSLLGVGTRLTPVLQTYKEGLTLGREGFASRQAEIESDRKTIERMMASEKKRLQNLAGELGSILRASASSHESALSSATADTIEARCRDLARDLMTRVDAVTSRYVQDFSADIGDFRTSGLEDEIRSIIKTIEFGKVAATALITALLTTGVGNVAEAGIGASTKAIAKTASRTLAKSIGMRIVKTLGDVVEKINPVNFAGDLIEQQWKHRAISGSMPTLVANIQQRVVAQLEMHFEHHIFAPQREKLDLQDSVLRKLAQEQLEATRDLDERRLSVEKDQRMLRDTLKRLEQP